MSLSMSHASVDSFVRTLDALAVILDKGAAHADAKKFDAANLVGARLIADMLPMARQIMIATDQAKNGTARLAGVEPPKFEDNETTVDQLKARVAKTAAFLKTLDAKAIDAAADKEITFPVGPNKMKMKGADYLTGFVLPNFYFHATMAYALLRQNGVDVGKRDFLGAIPALPA